ncbi:ribulose-phosphate 3-epimerase [Faecalicatena orotica]|nr:ribulose-phosphate 3-epimerase [Faecalicatena orotica]
MDKSISPSLICMDLVNLETSVKELEAAGCEMLHVDVLDGYFSPSMPIGLDTIRQLRKKTDLYFDAHVMAVDNTYFMEELADIGVGRMCFQAETERHLSRKLSWLKEKGIEAGVALAPGTSVETLRYVLEQCDFVLLMMINPGFASSAGETMLSGMKEKISDLRKLIEEQKTDTTITIDGRTYLDVIPDYMRRGASTFVAGTSALFRKNGKSVAENYKILKHVIQETKEGM